MADDNLPPDDARPPSKSRIECEYCGCALTASGEIIKMSPRAKSLRKLEDELEDARAAFADADKKLKEAERQVAELKSAGTGVGSGSREDWE